MILQYIQSILKYGFVGNTISFIFILISYLGNHTVHAKNEASGLVLTWAHNLFVMWALDFLTWVVLSSETQHNTLLLQIRPLSLLLLSLCSLLYVLSRIIHQPQFPILISYLQLKISGGVMITQDYQWARGSNSIVFKWVFSWEQEQWLWNWFAP